MPKEERPAHQEAAQSQEATYRAIGMFIHAFSMLEHSMRYYLAVEVGLDDKFAGAIITHDFALLCTAVQEVFGETLETDEMRKQLKKQIKKAREINDQRVKVVHGMWLPDRSGGSLFHVARSSLRANAETDMARLLERQTELTQEIDLRLTSLFHRAPQPDG